MGSVLRLVLSAQTVGNLGGHTPQSFACCIDDEPVTSDCFRFSTICLHVIPASGGASHYSGESGPLMADSHPLYKTTCPIFRTPGLTHINIKKQPPDFR